MKTPTIEKVCETESASDTESLVIDPQTIAKRLNISASSVYKAMQNGELPCIKIGRRRLVPRRQFEAWINGTTLTNKN